MSVQLEILDGSPWWLSPDVWTVPGDDPEGSPGLPIVGHPCYVWARVHNTGSNAVSNALVRFYWANPSVGFDRTTANHIGNANVSLNAGETSEFLCLVPWMPTFVNDGHECVLAEVFHSTQDPLPASALFNVPTDRHVAQRNLTVLETAPNMKKFIFSFEIHNTERKTRYFSIKTTIGQPKELAAPLKQMGIDEPRGQGKLVNIGFITSPIACYSDEKPQPTIDLLEVLPGARKGLSIVGELEGDSAVLHVIQEADGNQVGGLSILVLDNKKKSKKGRV